MGIERHTTTEGQLSLFMRHLDAAMSLVGMEEDRKKLVRQILLYGAPSHEQLSALPDISAMRMALEAVQTWFNAQPSSPPSLRLEMLMRMNMAGYPIEGESVNG